MTLPYAFIVLEGVDYSGKSTILEKMLKPNNLWTYPSVPTIDHTIINSPSMGVESRFEYLLEHNREFGARLKLAEIDDQPVALVRYFLTLFAFHQVLASRNGMRFNSHEYISHCPLTPDHTILLTTTRDELLERIARSPPTHIYESDANLLLEVQKAMIAMVDDKSFRPLYGECTVVPRMSTKEERVAAVNEILRNVDGYMHRRH